MQHEARKCGMRASVLVLPSDRPWKGGLWLAGLWNLPGGGVLLLPGRRRRLLPRHSWALGLSPPGPQEEVAFGLMAGRQVWGPGLEVGQPVPRKHIHTGSICHRGQSCLGAGGIVRAVHQEPRQHQGALGPLRLAGKSP